MAHRYQSNYSYVGTQVYTGQEFQEVIMVNGLSVGDQFVVSKAIKTSSGFPLKL